MSLPETHWRRCRCGRTSLTKTKEATALSSWSETKSICRIVRSTKLKLFNIAKRWEYPIFRSQLKPVTTWRNFSYDWWSIRRKRITNKAFQGVRRRRTWSASKTKNNSNRSRRNRPITQMKKKKTRKTKTKRKPRRNRWQKSKSTKTWYSKIKRSQGRRKTIGRSAVDDNSVKIFSTK
jgi:hypothetical protein